VLPALKEAQDILLDLLQPLLVHAAPLSAEVWLIMRLQVNMINGVLKHDQWRSVTVSLVWKRGL
jgi:hypothetical protein